MNKDNHEVKEYKVNNEAPEITEYNYCDLYFYLKDFLTEVFGFTEKFFKKLQGKFLISKQKDPKIFYSCPICGKFNCLDIGLIADSEEEKYTIFCNKCNFVCPDTGGYSDTWNRFHNWLIKNNYIVK